MTDMLPITFPHIGDLAVALEGTFRNLGVPYIAPEKPNARILAIGRQHSPEFVCFPFKIVLGELIVALEKGARTLGMLGGNGPCRFGYYDVVMSDILNDLGYEFRMLSMDDPDRLFEFIKTLRGFIGNPPWRRMVKEVYLFCRKLAEFDRVQQFFDHHACLAVDIKDFSRCTARAKQRIADATTLGELRHVVRESGIKRIRLEKKRREAQKAEGRTQSEKVQSPESRVQSQSDTPTRDGSAQQGADRAIFNSTPQTPNPKPQAPDSKQGNPVANIASGELATVELDTSRQPVTVGLIGEIYTVCDPESNFHVERRLAEMGVRVERALWLSRWVNDRLPFMPFVRNQHKAAKKKAKEFLKMHPGGECIVSVGESVEFARRRLDGIIHLMPFTCMPEIVAQTILPAVRKKYEIPILTLALDEHTDPAGLATRLEAFCDFLERKRDRRSN